MLGESVQEAEDWEWCMVQALEKVSDILAQERGNLTVEEQVQQLLQSLQHDSASVKATALQVPIVPQAQSGSEIPENAKLTVAQLVAPYKQISPYSPAPQSLCCLMCLIMISVLSVTSLRPSCMLLQELQPYLQSHRSWLSGLWTSSSNSASFESRKEQALQLSQLLGSLLKCCNPEVLN